MSDHEEKKKIGIKDIARLANVSIATVDRVLNNRKDVSEKTRQKIKEIIKEHNYQPNLYARSLSVKNNLSFADTSDFAGDRLLAIVSGWYQQRNQ